MSTPDGYMDIQQAAEYLNISANRVYHLLQEGVLGEKYEEMVSRKRLIARDALDSWMVARNERKDIAEHNRVEKQARSDAEKRRDDIAGYLMTHIRVYSDKSYILSETEYADRLFASREDVIDYFIANGVKVQLMLKVLADIEKNRFVHCVPPPENWVMWSDGQAYLSGQPSIPPIQRDALHEYLRLPFAPCLVEGYSPAFQALFAPWYTSVDSPRIFPWLAGLIQGSIHQKIMYIWGKGATGKSTFAAYLKYMLGDMCMTMTDSTKISNEYYLAMMEGKRVVIIQEHTKDELNQIVKTLSGGDSITARQPFGQPYTFQPQLQLIILSNEPPTSYDYGDAIKRRLLVIETMPIKEKSSSLLADLKQHAPSDIAHLLEDYGSPENQALIDSWETPQTYASTDSVEVYLSEWLIQGYRVFALADLYIAYRASCLDEIGMKPVSRPQMVKRLLGLGYKVTPHDTHHKRVVIFDAALTTADAIRICESGVPA